MPRGISIDKIFKPLAKNGTQSFLGKGVHTLGLLAWILKQTGKADIYLSTFSTSDAFLRGFYNLRKKGQIDHAVMLADLKASKKTVKLYKEMQSCFDYVYLTTNHSKVVLIQNDSHLVTVISSQNQTYGDRAECTLVTTNPEIFLQQFSGFKEMVDEKSIQLNDLFNGLTDADQRIGGEAYDHIGDFRPFGY